MITVSTPQIEGEFFASKWLHIPMLLSAYELKELFGLWQEGFLFLMGCSLEKEKLQLSRSFFLESYSDLLEELQKGVVPSREKIKKILPALFTLSTDPIYLQSLPEEKYLVRLRKPAILLQPHFFRFSPLDNSFRSMVMGGDSIFW